MLSQYAREGEEAIRGKYINQQRVGSFDFVVFLGVILYFASLLLSGTCYVIIHQINMISAFHFSSNSHILM